MNTKKRKSFGILASTLIFGFSWFAIGFFGSLIINPEASMGPLLGIFVTGPIGFALGGIISSIANKIRHQNESRSLNQVNPFPKIWNWIIWASAGLAVIVIVSAYIFVPEYENKNSDIIREASDLDKRDKILTYLRIRSLSDNDLTKLQSFEQLESLDFCSGFGVEDAKITDNGLKIISELNLSKLSSLNFCKCDKITDNGLNYLVKMPNLVFLGLSECNQITDAGLEILISSTSLSNLKLGNNKNITKNSLPLVVKLKNLRFLGFSENKKITDEWLEVLVSSSTLEGLDLTFCDGITDNSVEILKRIPNLREVMLAGCKNISESARAELSKKVKVY